MTSLLLLLSLLLLPPISAVHAQQDSSDQQIDSVTIVPLLSDSEKVALDSAAVAALTDTTTTQTISRGTGVLLFGRDIFRVYSPLGPYPEAERAIRISHRLTELARGGANVDSIEVVDGHVLTGLRLHGQILMSVTDADASALGVSRMEAARQYASSIRREITEYRQRSTFQSILRASLFAILLFVVFLLLLKGLARLHRWVSDHLTKTASTRIRSVTVGTVEFLSSDQILKAGRAGLQFVRLATAALLFYVFLTSVFGLFPWTASWSRLLLHYMITPLKAVAQQAIDALPDLLAIIVIIVVIRAVIKLSNFLFAQLRDQHITLPGFYPEFAEPTRKIVRFLLIVLSIFLIYPYTPVADSGVFQGLTIFLGILFSIGSSSAVANIVAGIVLTYTRAFQFGDRIKIGETVGDVIEKTFLITRIRTAKNEDVAIPNSAMLSNPITNYSSMSRSGGGVILHTSLTIGYDVAWPKVERLLLQAAFKTSGVESQPPPFILTTALGDFSVTYQINVYTLQPAQMSRIYSDLHRNVQDAFADEGVEILSPAYEAQRDGSALAVPRADSASP